MLFKEVKLFFEHVGVEAEYNPSSALAIVRLKELVSIEDEVNPESAHIVAKNEVEVYLDPAELKEVIKVLQQILPEDEA
jgi:hypothetical protein